MQAATWKRVVVFAVLLAVGLLGWSLAVHPYDRGLDTLHLALAFLQAPHLAPGAPAAVAFVDGEPVPVVRAAIVPCEPPRGPPS